MASAQRGAGWRGRVSATRDALLALYNVSDLGKPSRVIPGYDRDHADRTARIVMPMALALGLEDRWVLSRLNRTIARVNQLLEDFQPGEAQRQVYDFLWGEYCDWYLTRATGHAAAGAVPVRGAGAPLGQHRDVQAHGAGCAWTPPTRYSDAMPKRSSRMAKKRFSAVSVLPASRSTGACAGMKPSCAASGPARCGCTGEEP